MANIILWSHWCNLCTSGLEQVLECLRYGTSSWSCATSSRSLCDSLASAFQTLSTTEDTDVGSSRMPSWMCDWCAGSLSMACIFYNSMLWHLSVNNVYNLVTWKGSRKNLEWTCMDNIDHASRNRLSSSSMRRAAAASAWRNERTYNTHATNGSFFVQDTWQNNLTNKAHVWLRFFRFILETSGKNFDLRCSKLDCSNTKEALNFIHLQINGIYPLSRLLSHDKCVWILI